MAGHEKIIASSNHASCSYLQSGKPEGDCV